jgi:hypothetical protein
MSDAGKLLLNKLINSYKKQHESYKETRSSVRLFYGWLLISVPCMLFLTGLSWAVYEFKNPIKEPVLVVLICIVLVVILFRNFCRIHKAKRKLERLKSDLEEVGLRIVCPGTNTRKDRYGELCIIKEEDIDEFDDVIPKSKNIDFYKYDIIFRL